MAKSKKNGKQGKGKVLEAKSGVTAADRPRARPAQKIKAAPPSGKPKEKLSSKAYEKELGRLHIELVKLQNWIKAKGFKAVVGNDIYCLHHKPPTNWSPSNAVSGAMLELKCGLVYSKNFRNMIYYPFFTFYWFLQIGLQSVKHLSPT